MILTSGDVQRVPSVALGVSRSHSMVDSTNDRQALNDVKHNMSHPSDTDGLLSATAVSYAPPGNTRPLERYSLGGNKSEQRNLDSLAQRLQFHPLQLEAVQRLLQVLWRVTHSASPIIANQCSRYGPSLYHGAGCQSLYPLLDNAAASMLSSASGLSSRRLYSPTLANVGDIDVAQQGRHARTELLHVREYIRAANTTRKDG